MIIATHSGKFHADDVWAAAVLNLIFPNSELVRTRDPAAIARADFAVDVGGVWDPEKGRFDHHQKGFQGARASGVVYASAGLVWKEYGPRCVSLVAEQAGHAPSPTQATEIAHAIDADLVQYLDMSDTGAARSAPGSYGLSAIISGFNPSWLDEQAAGSAEAADALRLTRFRRAMEIATDILRNGVLYRVGALQAVQQVRQSQRLDDGRLLFLENSALPWASIVRNEMPQILFVISHSVAEQRYMLHTVPSAAESFDARKDLPQHWAGLQGEQLAAATGVPDAVFCHNNLFIAACKSWDGVLDMARQALDA
ncbi:MYG1 family protein [Noviherbaspirillum soli]|uniref:MYG1 family protein n=1 Tax=Noviherbaspirillum soli TaxID=1064518 RepID=UPI00188D14D7|nr:MYG1 family protein [Noviherbaspirillum soli]